ncbi:MAG: formylglycine-generating enzyme family protein [Planctomycetota bacterium]|nr:formylglycine-generating enzyme family protein [Planctomycetota bacterium]
MSSNQRIRRNARVVRGSCEVALVILALSAGCRTDGEPSDAGSAQAPQTKPIPTTQATPSQVREPSEDSLILDLGGGVTMELVRIEPGTFLMGLPESDTRYSFNLDYEGPQHRVRFGNPFFLGKYEVTQAQWKAVMDNNPSAFRGDELPVEQVSWNDCQEFCRRLSQRTGTKIRLPSEAEWEYTCRAGTTTRYYYGDTMSTDQVNFMGNYTRDRGVVGLYRRKTTPVGAFSANAWGLYDMHGNVRELCQDAWHNGYSGAPGDGAPWTGGDPSLRIGRGGHWNEVGERSRVTHRLHIAPDDRDDDTGIRVAADAP